MHTGGQRVVQSSSLPFSQVNFRSIWVSPFEWRWRGAFCLFSPHLPLMSLCLHPLLVPSGLGFSFRFALWLNLFFRMSVYVTLCVCVCKIHSSVLPHKTSLSNTKMKDPLRCNCSYYLFFSFDFANMVKVPYWYGHLLFTKKWVRQERNSTFLYLGE